MGRKGLLAMVAAAMAAALLVGLSQAPASTAPQQEQRDASCQETGNAEGRLSVSDVFVLAQTFSALNTGRLTSVEVPVQNFSNTGSLVMEIRPVDASGVPTQTVLATTSVPASQIPDDSITTVRGSFDPGAEVVAGQRYALSLSAPEGAFLWEGSNENPCPDGQAYLSADGGQSFFPLNSDFDLLFTAFVTPPEPKPEPEPEPRPDPDGRCTIEGTRRGDTLMGTPGPDVICGFGGGDVLIGKGGRDVLRGGAGDDALDAVDGVRGNDTADGGRGNDGCATDRRDERKGC